MAKQMRMIKKR